MTLWGDDPATAQSHIIPTRLAECIAEPHQLAAYVHQTPYLNQTLMLRQTRLTTLPERLSCPVSMCSSSRRPRRRTRRPEPSWCARIIFWDIKVIVIHIVPKRSISDPIPFEWWRRRIRRHLHRVARILEVFGNAKVATRVEPGF